jgi:hypothetical protein
MNSEEKSCSKRKNNETLSTAKLRFDQLLQAMEETPPRKKTKKSELKKTTPQDPQKLFEEYFINPKRGSIGFEIKSKLTRKTSGKRQKNKSKEKGKNGSDETGGVMKYKQIYKECLKKKPDYVLKINIEEFFRDFTPIPEKNQEDSDPEGKNKSENKKINVSLLTPNDHLIKIPNSYRRQKAKKHEKKLN